LTYSNIKLKEITGWTLWIVMPVGCIEEPVASISSLGPKPTISSNVQYKKTPEDTKVPLEDKIENLLAEDEQYLYFQRMIRNYIVSENPGITTIDIVSKTYELWSAMSEVEKQEITDGSHRRVSMF
jgi:hypothetical protein